MDSQVVEIAIENCKSIKKGVITLTKNKLNIKVGMNGTGKSTISEAIEINAKSNNCDSLKSFFANKEDVARISSTSSFKKIAVYNENFINQIVFQGNALIDNPFQVFIATPDYEAKKKELVALTSKLKIFVNDNQDGIALNESFRQLSELVTLTKEGSISKRSKITVVNHKYNYEKIPINLSQYKPFFSDSDLRVGWIDWKNNGSNKYDGKNICPFCASKLPEKYDQEKKDFSNLYKKADAANLTIVAKLFESCKDFIVESRYLELQQCIQDESLSEDTVQKIIEDFYNDVNYLSDKFSKINSFDSSDFTIRDINKIPDEIKGLTIEISRLNYFRNEKSLLLFTSLNKEIQNLEKQSTLLKEEMGKLKGTLLSTIKKSKEDMNSFLSNAGFPYQIRIETQQNESAIATLVYLCDDKTELPVDSISTHLSWGERNAFGVVLFMYYACAMDADLIILDDPVSSFDSNKKYVIMHRLFEIPSSKIVKSLYGKTVLLLTHDYEPLIDSVIVNKLDAKTVVATYLENNNHIINEKSIGQEDLIPMVKFLKTIARDPDVPKVCRLSAARKYLEHTEDVNKRSSEGYAYDILSSCVHGLGFPSRKTSREVREKLNATEYNSGNLFLNELFSEPFDYQQFLNECTSVEKLIEVYESQDNTYFKLQVYREIRVLIKENQNYRAKLSCITTDSDLSKFVDESFHIENDYAYVLDYRKYHLVPSCFSVLIEENIKLIKEKLIVSHSES